MAIITAAARSPASRLPSLPQKRGAALDVAVDVVGAAEAAKPAPHDPRLLPQSRQSPARSATRWRSIQSLQARQLRDSRRSYKSGELPLPLLLMLWERRKSRSPQRMTHGFSRHQDKNQPRNTTRWRSIRPLEGHQPRDSRRSHKSRELPLPLPLLLLLLCPARTEHNLKPSHGIRHLHRSRSRSSACRRRSRGKLRCGRSARCRPDDWPGCVRGCVPAVRRNDRFPRLRAS